MPVDIVTAETRSRIMSGIRGKDTIPELLIRSALHREGFRFRLHRKDLPGRPDLVFPRLDAVLFVHGCFWHGHGCSMFKWPSTRQEFWRRKIEGNAARDRNLSSALQDMGWRIATVWECALKGSVRLPLRKVVEVCAMWLNSRDSFLEVTGDEKRSTR